MSELVDPGLSRGMISRSGSYRPTLSDARMAPTLNVCAVCDAKVLTSIRHALARSSVNSKSKDSESLSSRIGCLICLRLDGSIEQCAAQDLTKLNVVNGEDIFWNTLIVYLALVPVLSPPHSGGREAFRSEISLHVRRS